MKLVKKVKKGKMKLIAKKKAAKKRKLVLVGKRKATRRAKKSLLGGRRKAVRRAKKSLLGGRRRKAPARGGPRERSGRFSIFRPKVRGRAYPVQDNIAGWKLFDRIAKQAELSGSDIFTLGMRLLARDFPEITKDTAIALGKRLDDYEFKLAS